MAQAGTGEGVVSYHIHTRAWEVRFVQAKRNLHRKRNRYN